MFRENGFRFIPNIISPANVAGKEVVFAPYKGIPKPHAGSIVSYQPGQPNPYSSAVASIIKGNCVFGNILECIDKLGTIMANFFRDLPNSGRIYLASRGIFLVLNITSVQYNSFMYLIWGVSTSRSVRLSKTSLKSHIFNFMVGF